MQIKEKMHSNLFTIFIMIIGICSIIIGVSRGEAPVMFEKAISICLECIGIG